MKAIIVIVLILTGIVLAWEFLRPPATEPGAFLHSSPFQRQWFGAPIVRDKWKISPVAAFQVDGRVLGVRSYHEDEESDISPLDIAIAWGPLIQDDVFKLLEVDQSDRFYHWTSEQIPLPADRVSQSSTNIHIIPATPEVLAFLTSLRPGQFVSLKGRLVNASRSDGFRWRSSLSRSDTGEGACELLYVEQAVALSDPGILGKKLVDTFPEPPSAPVRQPTRAATPPSRITTFPPRPLTPLPRPLASPTRRTLVLKTRILAILEYGSLTIPKDETITVLGISGNKLKAEWRGVEFWTESSILPE